MQVMTCRLEGLTQAMEGLRQSGAPLVGLPSDGRYRSLGFNDDVGQDYAIPKLALTLDIPLDSAIDLVW